MTRGSFTKSRLGSEQTAAAAENGLRQNLTHNGTIIEYYFGILIMAVFDRDVLQTMWLVKVRASSL